VPQEIRLILASSPRSTSLGELPGKTDTPVFSKSDLVSMSTLLGSFPPSWLGTSADWETFSAVLTDRRAAFLSDGGLKMTVVFGRPPFFYAYQAAVSTPVTDFYDRETLFSKPDKKCSDSTDRVSIAPPECYPLRSVDFPSPQSFESSIPMRRSRTAETIYRYLPGHFLLASLPCRDDCDPALSVEFLFLPPWHSFLRLWSGFVARLYPFESFHPSKMFHRYSPVY